MAGPEKWARHGPRTPRQAPGVFLRRDVTESGRRIAAAYDAQGVEVLTYAVPAGVEWSRIRWHMESLLSLHRSLRPLD